MILRLILLFLACTIFTGLEGLAFHPQTIDTTILARVGNRTISSTEFTTRFSLTIFPQKDVKRNLDAVKKEFLLSLIAEKLLAEEAHRKNVDQDAVLQMTMKNTQEMFMRDKLFRDEIRSKVKVSEKEIRIRFEKQLHEVEYQFLFSNSEQEITNLKSLLDQGMPFDSLLTAQRSEDKTVMNSGTASAVESELRKVIRRLTPGQISEPIRISSGFYIIRKMPELTAERKEELFLEQRRSIERILRSEKEYTATIKFVKSLWKGKRAIINKEHFAAIGRELKQDLERSAAADTSDILQPDPEAFAFLRDKFGMRIEEKFFSIDRDSVSVRNAIDRLELKSFIVKKNTVAEFPGTFKSIVQEIIDEYLITREAYRRRLQFSDEVKKEMAMWIDNGLAQSLIEDLWDQFIASDDSVWNFYLQNPRIFGSPLEIKIIEVLHSSRDTLQSLLKRIKKGESFVAIAMDYSERDGARERRGELGYFPITKYPEFGRPALAMQINDLSNIIKLSNAYSFFQLIGKRKKSDNTLTSIDEIRTQIEKKWRAGIKQSRFNKFVANLASKSSIQIFDDALKTLDVTPSQMFTIRYLGFGGKIPAAPSVMPLYQPVLEGLERQEYLQQ